MAAPESLNEDLAPTPVSFNEFLNGHFSTVGSMSNPQPPWQDPTVFTSHANVSEVIPESLGYRLKRLILGRPYVTEQLSGERLSQPVALGVLAPDCISSSAYGTEQILTQMVPYIGLAAFSLVLPVMLVILGVLFLVTSSYFDVIKYYTTAGGSYVVARDNFGPRIAQLASVALLIDYIVTVAVQCSAGTAALTSAVPSLGPYMLEITVGVVILLIYGNLRGIREAGRIFAFPTYFYVAMLSLTIVVGIVKQILGQLHHIAIPPAHLLIGGQLGTSTHTFLYGLSFMTLLRAYANGGSSLTGLEAISNGVASFRRPVSRHAHQTMLTMAGILAFLLLGVTVLASWTHAMPYAAGTPTVVSQEVRAVFGHSAFGSVIFYLVQLATLLILYTGGNTSFNGFPFLASFVAKDGYLPRQLTKRGHRLAFSNGIIVLGVVAIVLIIAFDAKLNALVALYAVGVFTGFALAGSGLAKKHYLERGPHWKRSVAINGLSALVTLLVVVIFLVAKFTEGAWVVAVVGPVMYFTLLRLNRQYRLEADQFQGVDGPVAIRTRQTRVLIFVDSYDLATERAVLFCQSLSASSVQAVHFDIDPAVTRDLEGKWGRPGSATYGITLEVFDCNDRRVDRAALQVVADVVRDPEVFCMVILPRRGFTSRLQRVLHDRTADAISDAIMHIPRTSATIVPFRWTERHAGSHGQRVLENDEVQRGGIRASAGLDADRKLAERSVDADSIGGVRHRDRVKVAGRVRSIAVKRGSNWNELRCSIEDESGAITLVFQGRTEVPGIARGTRLLAEGTVISHDHNGVIMNPLYEIIAEPQREE